MPRLFRLLAWNAAVIFVLHRIADPDRGVRGHPTATVRSFLQHLRRQKYQLVGLDALFDGLAGRGPRIANAVAFTIDDGYQEQATIACPLFAEFDCPVTSFVATGFVDGSLWFWWDQIEYAFNHCKRPNVTVKLDDAIAHYELGNESEREFAAADFARRCKAMDDHRKSKAISQLAVAADVHLPGQAPPAYAPMTWHDVRACEQRGMTFAPHSVTHPILARTGDAEVRREILESCARLRQEVLRPVNVFAYPNGQLSDFGEREFSLIREAGLCGAVTAVPGRATPQRYRTTNGELLVPRIPFADSLPYLIQQVDAVERLKSIARRGLELLQYPTG